jgi:hypothetical protein
VLVGWCNVCAPKELSEDEESMNARHAVGKYQAENQGKPYLSRLKLGDSRNHFLSRGGCSGGWERKPQDPCAADSELPSTFPRPRLYFCNAHYKSIYIHYTGPEGCTLWILEWVKVEVVGANELRVIANVPFLHAPCSGSRPISYFVLR